MSGPASNGDPVAGAIHPVPPSQRLDGEPIRMRLRHEEGEESGLVVEIHFPRFDLVDARKATPVVRSALRRDLDYATIAEVHTAARHAQACALIAARELMLGGSKVQSAEFTGQLNTGLRQVATALVRDFNLALLAYDEWRRQQAWYRRLWRAVRRREADPFPALVLPPGPAATGIAVALPSEPGA